MKWTDFYDILDYKYQLDNCIFYVENEYFYKFQKKLICYELSNSELNTNNLDNETLLSKIMELAKDIYNKMPYYIYKNYLIKK